MTTRRKKSAARKRLETLAGAPLSLGMLLKAIREGEGWNLSEMADKLQVTRGFVSNIEKGKPVSPESAARYAHALGYGEEQFVRLALQDQIERAGLDYQVQISHRAQPHLDDPHAAGYE